MKCCGVSLTLSGSRSLFCIPSSRRTSEINKATRTHTHHGPSAAAAALEVRERHGLPCNAASTLVHGPEGAQDRYEKSKVQVRDQICEPPLQCVDVHKRTELAFEKLAAIQSSTWFQLQAAQRRRSLKWRTSWRSPPQ
jgi:hypothetical protein